MASTAWSPDLRRPIYTTRVLCEVANERGVATSDRPQRAPASRPPISTTQSAVVTAPTRSYGVRRLLAVPPADAGLGVDVG